MGVNWDVVRAPDLLVLFRNYLKSRAAQQASSGFGMVGSVYKVTVYPSDFGLEQIAREDIHGPDIQNVKLTKEQKRGKTEEQIEEMQKLVANEGLRRYQQNRTKYFW